MSDTTRPPNPAESRTGMGVTDPPRKWRTAGAALITCLTMGAAGLLTSAEASAATHAPVAAKCGATLTANAYLEADLTCPANKGVTLAGNITLDLNHHRLTGSKGAAISIRNATKPLIKNGTVYGWATGVAIIPSADGSPGTGTVAVTGVTFTKTTTAIEASGGGNYNITNTVFDSNQTGIDGFFTGLITVTGSTFHRNSFGVHADTAALAVSKSRFDRNTTGVATEEVAATVTKSTFQHNGTGITTRTSGATATSNIFSDNTIGFDSFAVFGPPQNLTSNTFANNATGVNFFASGGSVTRNAFTGNTVGFTSTGDDPTWAVATLDGNSFYRNADGINVKDGGNSLKGNTANNNSGWGIYAPGSTDLGGNHAAGNGRTPQCVGVKC